MCKMQLSFQQHAFLLAAMGLLSINLYAADSAIESYTLEAMVPQVANITNIAASTNNGLVFNGSNTFTVAPSAFNETDATLNDTTIASSITFDGIINYAHQASFRSTNDGMIVAAGDKVAIVSGDFLDVIDYTVFLVGPGTVLNLDTSSEAEPNNTKTTTIAGATQGAYIMSIAIDTNANNTPLLAGNYSDTLTLKLGAAF